MAGMFESPLLSDELAQMTGRALDGLFAKDKYVYVLVVKPLDHDSESMTVSNTTQEFADKLLEHSLEGSNGEAVPVPPVS